MEGRSNPRGPGRHPLKNGQMKRFQESRQVYRRGFDENSGQVFNETEVVFRSKNATNWIRDLRTPNIVQKAKHGELGARSLFDMARSRCASEVRDFTPEHFEAVPWTIAESLWEEVVERHMESFYSWRTLASTYGSPAEFGKSEARYFFALKQTPLPLVDYFAGLTSAQRLWHVALRISPKQSTVSDLVALSKITNLAVLDLSDGQLLLDSRPCIFDLRIMRTWAELSALGRAFGKLRVLMFGWQDSLSLRLFEHLDQFPSLRYVIVTDCKDLHQKNRSDWETTASQKGWTALHAKKSAKALRPLLDDKNFQLGNVSNLYYQSCGSNIDTEAQPLVECWIGTPKPWTHIIDEFPGTRTIWFERNLDGPNTTIPEAPKRVRDRTKTLDATSSPPAKRAQRQQRKIKDSSKQRMAFDAKKILDEMGRSVVRSSG